MADVGVYPFKQAAHYTKGRTASILWIVIHDMEVAETSKSAESVANVFANPNGRVASAHLCIDNDSIVRCVHDADTAYHAAGANNRGLGIEHAGRAAQTRVEWLDAYGVAMLTRSARAAAAWCKAYRIPPVKLSAADLRAGKPGFAGHRDVEAAWPSTGHSDPGLNFPWDWYLARVKYYLNPPPPAYKYTQLPLKVGSRGADVKHAQGRLGIPNDGIFGSQTLAHVKGFQQAHHLTVTGVIDAKTAAVLG